MERSLVNIGILIFSLILLTSCKDDKEDYLETLTSVKEAYVPNSAKLNEPFDVTLTIYGSSECSEFSRFTTSTYEETMYINLYQRRDKALNCSDNIVEIETTITLNIEEPKIKYLKFNHEPSIFSDITDVLNYSIILEN